nr:hypothetical protein [Bartonella tamiae]
MNDLVLLSENQMARISPFSYFLTEFFVLITSVVTAVLSMSLSMVCNAKMHLLAMVGIKHSINVLFAGAEWVCLTASLQPLLGKTQSLNVSRLMPHISRHTARQHAS